MPLTWHLCPACVRPLACLLFHLTYARTHSHTHTCMCALTQAYAHTRVRTQDIVGLVSVEGENIPFITPVETQGELNGVERWLLKSEDIMRKSLASITKDAIEVWRACAKGAALHRWRCMLWRAVCGCSGCAGTIDGVLCRGIVDGAVRAR